MALANAPVLANGPGENGNWQFKSSAEKVNQAAVQDLIQKRSAGHYNAPVYTTNIARQINCYQTATATGNQGNLGAAALSPSTGGATSDSTGNANAHTSSETGTSASDQSNSGKVTSNVRGDTTSGVNGTSYQALNSNQSNSGTQGANVTGSTGCSFGVVN